eukprot:TRINITY_DN2732_c0_g1_i2.p1 TRINITY_DN2732_c0_g1~~TRINITY_DN2732_c0_g1_i2.p1  ORF type:complete len:466 (-),score=70.83 TRINITY_DN2732_c0_g1_i2:124-1521(-)
MDQGTPSQHPPEDMSQGAVAHHTDASAAGVSLSRARSFLDVSTTPRSNNNQKNALQTGFLQKRPAQAPKELVKQMSRPAVAQRMNTHAGDYNPAWRTKTALVPDSQSWSQRRPSTEVGPFNIEDHISLQPEEIHVRELIHTDSRLTNLSITDFIPASDILVVTQSETSSEPGVLGEGSQGTILKATLKSRATTEQFAVKCSESAEILDEFCIMKQFSHPNVLKAIAFSVAEYGAEEDDYESSDISESSQSSANSTGSSASSTRGRWFYMAIYEYCAGNNLYKYLQSHSGKSRDVPYLKRLFGGLIAALDHIHSKGYIHCDLKPENILVNAKGDPVLADFGLAQKLKGINHHPQGTPSYLAPEVVNAWFTPKAAHVFTETIDIFSLGVVAVNVVTGKYPFKRVTARLRAKHQYTALELATIFTLPQKRVEEMAAISGLLSQLVVKCLQRDPASRPTAAQLLALLNA